MSEALTPLMTPAPTSLEIDLPATQTSLLACLATIGDFGALAKLSPEVVARARIVVEELYSNTIKYGYAGECERPVKMRLSAHGALTLIYEDDAAPFDPTGWRHGGSQAAEALREGELGLALLFGLASRVDYQPRAVGNRLVVVFEPRSAGFQPAS